MCCARRHPYLLLICELDGCRMDAEGKAPQSGKCGEQALASPSRLAGAVFSFVSDCQWQWQRLAVRHILSKQWQNKQQHHGRLVVAGNSGLEENIISPCRILQAFLWACSSVIELAQPAPCNSAWSTIEAFFVYCTRVKFRPWLLVCT